MTITVIVANVRQTSTGKAVHVGSTIRSKPPVGVSMMLDVPDGHEWAGVKLGDEFELTLLPIADDPATPTPAHQARHR